MTGSGDGAPDEDAAPDELLLPGQDVLLPTVDVDPGSTTLLLASPPEDVELVTLEVPAPVLAPVLEVDVAVLLVVAADEVDRLDEAEEDDDVEEDTGPPDEELADEVPAEADDDAPVDADDPPDEDDELDEVVGARLQVSAVHTRGSLASQRVLPLTS